MIECGSSNRESAPTSTYPSSSWKRVAGGDALPPALHELLSFARTGGPYAGTARDWVQNSLPVLAAYFVASVDAQRSVSAAAATTVKASPPPQAKRHNSEIIVTDETLQQRAAHSLEVLENLVHSNYQNQQQQQQQQQQQDTQ
jgi:hypothetical protein